VPDPSLGRRARDLVLRGHPWSSFWPALVAPATTGLVALAWTRGWYGLLQKGPHETAALVLTALAILVWLARAGAGRDPLAALMAFLSVAFFQREIHFEGSDEILDLMGIALAIWAWLWRARLAEPLGRGRRWPWLLSTGWTYLFSQLVARRVFRGFPLEEEIHVWVEEAVENAAHLMLIASAFADRLRRAVPR
jgi:hypothetical protein